jgi:hypothetical protein
MKVSHIRSNTAGSKIKNKGQMKNTINNHTNNSIIFVGDIKLSYKQPVHLIPLPLHVLVGQALKEREFSPSLLGEGAGG